MDILQGLNQQQKQAVESVDGPLLILAGPGSGKTRVITHRIAYLIAMRGLSPYRILAVTFTNKAAREMRERLRTLMGSTGENVYAGTFHAFCSSVLRQEHDAANIDKSFVIYDQADQIDLMKRVLEIEGIDNKQFAPSFVLSTISSAKSRLIDSGTFGMQSTSYVDKTIHRAYVRYQELLSRHSSLDFDDLLLRTYFLFRDNKHILEKYQSRYQHLLVDEFQDTNLVQYAIAQQITEAHGNICVVGDPDQSIYSWRNADMGNILSFKDKYPTATVIRLEENYRSTKTIVEAAQSVITSNSRRIERDLHTENPNGKRVVVHESYNPEEEAEHLLKEVRRLRKDENYKLDDIAVMYRVNAQSRAIEEGCLKYGIPYQLIGGLRFYQRKEIKDIVSYLRVIHNPYDDVSLLRIINMPPRGIGTRTLDQLSYISQSRGIPMYTAIQMTSQEGTSQLEHSSITSRAIGALVRFLDMINELIRESDQKPPHEIIEMLMDKTGYLTHINLDKEHQRDRLDNILELKSTALEFQQSLPQENLSTFLESIALVSDIDSIDEKKESIKLITLHQAKGLEFPVVFMVGLEEGMIPHFRSLDDLGQIEEERRLFYVGMTRAMQRLYLTRVFRRNFRGGMGIGDPSRFLSDIPLHLTARLANPFEAAVLPVGKRNSIEDENYINVTHELFIAGEKVNHTIFGEGIVVSCKNPEIVIAFKGDAGIKRLMLGIAPLEKVT